MHWDDYRASFRIDIRRLKICEGLHTIMDIEIVYKLLGRVLFRKQSARMLVARADCFTNQINVLTDFDELGRVVCSFFVFFF
jgi:hypothetical protein